MKKGRLTEIIREEIIKVINEEQYIDVYSFDKILPKKSRYNFKQAINKIVDSLESNGVNDTDAKNYVIELAKEAFKSDTNPIFMDY